jgi:Tfp pilus assembly protein PilZ
MIKLRRKNKKQSPVVQPDGHRPRKLRVPVSFEVRCELGAAVILTAEASNLNDSGICIKTNDSISIKDNLILEFHLPDEPNAIKAVGEVIWCRVCQEEDQRQILSFTAGIKFLEIDTSDTNLIRRFVSEMLKKESMSGERGMDMVVTETPISKEEKRPTRMSPHTYERRSGKDRRNGRDRRTGFDRRGRRQRRRDTDRRGGVDRRQTPTDLVLPSQP